MFGIFGFPFHAANIPSCKHSQIKNLENICYFFKNISKISKKSVSIFD